MFGTQAADVAAIEPATIEQAAGEQLALDPPAEVAAQPLRHRRTEAHLAAVDDLIRDESAYGFFEQVLRHPAADLIAHRDVHGELDQLVIEERHARFDRSRHADLVHAHEQQFRQT